MKQVVGHKKLNDFAGIALVLGLVAVLILLNYLVIDLLAARIGATAASIGFWVLGGLLAWLVLRVYIVTYTYETGAGVLRLCRHYGKRERFIEDIYLNQIEFVGTEEEAKAKYPRTKTVSAVHGSDKTPVTAVAYKTADSVRIARIQANDELKGLLVDQVKANKK